MLCRADLLDGEPAHILAALAQQRGESAFDNLYRSAARAMWSVRAGVADD